VPSVASQPPALKPVTPLASAAPSGARSASASPFESLLDDGTQAAAPPQPNNKPSPPPASPSQAPAQRDATPPVKTDGDAQAAGALPKTSGAQGAISPAKTDGGAQTVAASPKTGNGAQTSSALPKTDDAAPAVSALPKADDGAQIVSAPQAGDVIVSAGISQATGVKTNGTAAVAVEAPASGVPVQTIQAPADTQAGGVNPIGSDGVKADGSVKVDAKTTTQAAAADALKPASKDEPADAAKAADDASANGASAPAPDAGQPTTAVNVVVAVVAPVTAPVTPGPGETTASPVAIANGGAPKVTAPIILSPATPANAATIAADGAPLPQQDSATPLQAAKPDDDAKGSDKAAEGAGKPQPMSGSADKPLDTQTTSPADHQPAPFTTGAHAADGKAADTAAPLPAVTAQPQSAAAAQAAPPAAPTPQPLPQAAAVPLTGLGIEIAGRALAGKNRFEIRLDPPELGRIEVRLDVDKDGRITSHVIADRRDTLDLLQRDASGLQRALQDAGLKTADNGLQFSLRDQQQQQQQQQQNSGPANAGTAQLVVEDDAPLVPNAYSPLAGLAGGLDILV